jgi:hypothetical protein
MAHEIDSSAKIYPFWEVPILLNAYRYKELEWYEKAVESFWSAAEKGADKELVLREVLDCYSSYTGIKDSTYAVKGNWKYVTIEVPAFANQSVADSIEKYKRLANGSEWTEGAGQSHQK